MTKLLQNCKYLIKKFFTMLKNINYLKKDLKW